MKLKLSNFLTRKTGYVLLIVSAILVIVYFIYFPFYEGLPDTKDEEDEEDEGEEEGDEGEEEGDEEEGDEGEEEDEADEPNMWRDSADNFLKTLKCYFYNPHDKKCDDVDDIAEASELYVDAIRADALHTDVNNRLYK